MKIPTAALMLFLCFLLVSCTKSLVGPSTFQGKWKFTASFASAGSPGQWMDALKKKEYDYVKFSNNGDLEGTFFNNYKTYVVKDSTTMTFFKADQTIQNYSYQIQNGILTLSPAGPIYCIEGCAYRFVKVDSSGQ